MPRITPQIVFSFFCLFLLGGCAFGTNMSLEKTPLSLAAPATKEFAVAVWDRRPYVLSGDKTPEWIGLQRGGYGNPFGVHTHSGKPLAEDFATAISNNYRLLGIQIQTISIPPRSADREDVLGLLRQQPAKILLLTVNEWKSDTLVNVNFHFGLVAEVVDPRSGKTLATKELSGHEALDGSFWNPVGASERVTIAKQKEKLEQLLNSAEISQALVP